MPETGVTLCELVAGYERFNRWEAAEQQRELANLSLADGLTQFFELWSMADELAPCTEQVFIEQNKAHWAALRVKLQRLGDVTRRAPETHSSTR